MTLVLCPECHGQISTRASACPQCGYPLTGEARALVPGATAEPRPPRARTFISKRFALAATPILLTIGGFAIGGAEEEGMAIFAGLMVWSTIIPIWWKTRRAARIAAAAGGSAELERQLETRMKAMEERFRGPIAQLEDGSRQLMEIEERMEFLERLLTKQRNEQLDSG